MDTPEYIKIVRQHLADRRAVPQAQRAAAPPLSASMSAGEGSEQNEQNVQIHPAQAGSGSAPLEARVQIANKLRANSPPLPPADVAGALALLPLVESNGLLCYHGSAR